MEPNLKSEKVGYIVKTTIHTFEGIRPFQETPCEGRYGSDQSKESEEISANQLFSLFTADIIKEESIFIR